MAEQSNAKVLTLSHLSPSNLEREKQIRVQNWLTKHFLNEQRPRTSNNNLSFLKRLCEGRVQWPASPPHSICSGSSNSSGKAGHIMVLKKRLRVLKWLMESNFESHKHD